MRQSTVTLLVVLAASVFALWFFQTHEKVSRERWVGFRGEARVNNHLAAQMLLQELGFEAESKATLTPTEWMPEPGDTLFIGLTPSITIGSERDTILDWVADGGHLILRPPYPRVIAVDDFLETLDFQLIEHEYVENEFEEDEEEDAERQADSAADTDEYVDEESEFDNEYTLIVSGREYRIDLLQPESSGQSVVRDDGEIVVARREWGQGLITLLADSEYFNNDYLDSFDHSRLFADVVAGEFEPGKVWLIYQTTFSPLWEVIWTSAPYMVLGLAALFGLWLWAAMPVFGPRVVAEASQRRSIIEHVKAAGLFVWRHDAAESLMHSATAALLHEAESRHPGIGRQSKQRQAEIIARMTGMSAQKVMDVLNGQHDPRQREFTHSMQRLQSIRKEL